MASVWRCDQKGRSSNYVEKANQTDERKVEPTYLYVRGEILSESRLAITDQCTHEERLVCNPGGLLATRQ
jgi:hypothetical protein